MQFWFCIVLTLVFTNLVNSRVAKIVSMVNERDENGYHFKYRTSDGQEREETGKLVTVDGRTFYRVTGHYLYILDGKLNSIDYMADENGYRATSSLKELEESVRINSALLGSLAGGGLG